MKLSLYIPSTEDVDESAGEQEFERRVQRAEAFLSQLFGGATSVEATGSYVGDDGVLVRETVRVVYTFADEGELKQKKPVIEEKIRKWKRKYGQESFMYSMEPGEGAFL